MTLSFQTIDHIDEIRTTDVRDPWPSYYHRVCAHAFASNTEVYTEWATTVTDATGWIPPRSGNCVELVPGDGNIAVVTFTAADGSTVELPVAE